MQKQPIPIRRQSSPTQNPATTGLDFSKDFANPLAYEEFLKDIDLGSYLRDITAGEDGEFDFNAGVEEGEAILGPTSEPLPVISQRPIQIPTQPPTQNRAATYLTSHLDFSNALANAAKDFDWDSFPHGSNAGEDGEFDFDAGFMGDRMY